MEGVHHLAVVCTSTHYGSYVVEDTMLMLVGVTMLMLVGRVLTTSMQREGEKMPMMTNGVNSSVADVDCCLQRGIQQQIWEINILFFTVHLQLYVTLTGPPPPP